MWNGLMVALLSVIGVVIGSLTTWLSTKQKIKIDAAQQLRDEQAAFRADMFLQIGGLRQWSTQQDEKIQQMDHLIYKERARKYKCQRFLKEARNQIAQLTKQLEVNSAYIQELESRGPEKINN